MRTLLTAATVGILMVDCSGGSLPPEASPSTNNPALVSNRVQAAIRIAIPKRRRHGRPAFVSPATKGMTIALNGPTKLDETIGLRSSSPGCTTSASGTTCVVRLKLQPCATSANCYLGSIVTYDNVACAKTCTIPPGSHELSVNQSVAFAVVRGVPNAVSLTLDGIPASAALVPVPPSTLSGNSNAGFTLSKCTTQTQDVNVVGVDADGNQIVGPGAPSSPALTSDDTAHLAVGTLVPPSTFPLSPPATLTSTTIPSPGSVVHLTASVTPLSGTGASVVSSKINVTFNHDICGVLTEYSIPSGGHPSGIAAGSDGALWFTEPANYSIGRMTTSGAITEMTTPTAGSGPAGIAAGPNGAMWFAEPNTNAVGRVSNGSISEFSVITSSSQPFGITKGPDGNIWFTENGAGQIGSITPDGITIQEFTAPGLSHPNGITTGPDGHLWFADTAGKVGNITTAGLTAEESVAGASPSGIVAGPDGALWFAEGFGSNKIGRVTTDGTIAEYSIPTALSDSYGIVAGPDGALWFTEQMTNKIGRITTAGAVTVEYTVGSTPQGIAVGPDGLLWFAESGVAEIGRLQ